MHAIAHAGAIDEERRLLAAGLEDLHGTVLVDGDIGRPQDPAAQPVEDRRGLFGNGVVVAEVAAETTRPGADAISAVADGRMDPPGFFQGPETAPTGWFLNNRASGGMGT